jgi:hypothetical protein
MSAGLTLYSLDEKRFTEQIRLFLAEIGFKFTEVRLVVDPVFSAWPLTAFAFYFLFVFFRCSPR